MNFIARSLIAGICFLNFASCASQGSDPLERAATACNSGTAQIGLYDGFLQRLCGCTEGASDPILTGTPLTCTVALNAMVTFHFLGTQAPHQILSDGSPAFASSPYSDPKAATPIRAHAVQFTVAGSYRFRDVSDAGLTGTIIVTP